jgi:CheY-like chemotaxis protein
MLIANDDRPSLTDIEHQDHLDRRRDILVRLEGVENLAAALAGHWANVAERQRKEAASFRPTLESWRQLHGKRVLVIHDDPTLRPVMVRMLHQLGISPDAAPDGKEGLELARRNVYDLVLCDLNMRMPGMLVVEELRRSSVRPDVPVLLVSGIGSQKELEAVADELGAAAMAKGKKGVTAALAKGFKQEAFEEAVRRLLAPSVADMALAPSGAAVDIMIDEDETTH